MKKCIFPIATELDMMLPYSFVGVGIHYEQEHVCRRYGHPNYQWIQCRDGKGELCLRGKNYTLEAGKGMLLFPNEPHEYFSLTSSWTVDWIIFRGSDIDRFIQNILKVTESTVLEITTPHIIRRKLEALYETALSSFSEQSILYSALVYGILMDLLRFLSLNQNPSIANRTARLTPVFDYIENNFQRPLTLSELAGVVGLTPQYFCSIFKEVTFQSPLKYVNMVKIQKSKELLLENSQLLIKEVAQLVGFLDVSYFCAVFRRIEGMTPSEFCQLYR